MIVLDLPLRGERCYLHGTDMITGLQSSLPRLLSTPDAHLKSVSFHQQAIRAVGVALGQPRNGSGAVGRFLVATSTGTFEGFLAETNAYPSQRIPYDEVDIVLGRKIHRQGQDLTLTPNSRYTTVQTVVAAMKELCNTAHPLADGKHWMFGRLDLLSPLPSQATTLEINLTRVFTARFAVADLRLNGTLSGSIRFISNSPGLGRGE